MGKETVTADLEPKPRDAFKKEKLVLKVLGISFSETDSTFYKIYSYIMHFSITFMYPLLALREIIISEFEYIANVITYEFGAILVCAKVVVVLKHRSQLAKILNRFGKEPFLPNIERGGEKERKIMADSTWIINFQIYFYWGFATLCFAEAIIATLTKRLRSNDYHDWDLPYGAMTVLNITYSPNYEITWFYQNLSLVWIAILFATVDLLTAGILARLSYQFKMLQNNLRRLVRNSHSKMVHDKKNALLDKNMKDTSIIPWKYLQQSLKQAVEYHLEIMNTAEELESVITTLLLIIFLNSLILLCFSVYRASVTPFGDSATIRNLCEVIIVSFQVAMVCFWGNQIIVESEGVGRSIYETDFVGCDLKFQKALTLIIRRSQNPTKITAGKFANISLTTFAWVLRTSYSAFMVLHNRNQNKA